MSNKISNTEWAIGVVVLGAGLLPAADLPDFASAVKGAFATNHSPCTAEQAAKRDLNYTDNNGVMWSSDGSGGSTPVCKLQAS